MDAAVVDITFFSPERVVQRTVLGRLAAVVAEEDHEGVFFEPGGPEGGEDAADTVVEFGATRVDDSTQDYGLKDVVPLGDLRKAEGTKIDPLGNATSKTTSLIQLGREIRVANLVFNAAQYATGNKATLSGTSQWSDYTNTNPLSAMLDAMDSMIMRPTAMVVGQAAWTKLRQHPRIIEAVKGTGAGLESQGMISRQQLADLLELENIYVGQGFVNTAKKGAAASYSRVWGKHCALIHQQPVNDAGDGTTTFGFTAESGGGLRVRDWFDEKIGADGAQVVQVVDTVKEVIVANDLGYLFTNAVA